jgi:molecular chaperone DnaK
VKNEADSMVFQTEKMMKDLEDKVEADDKAKIEDELKKLKDLLEKANVETMSDAEIDALKSAKESLTNVFYEISSKLYQQEGAPDMDPNAAGAQNTENAADDDVVDADYKEV